MKAQNWISEAQQKFKLFKKLENLTGDCITQTSSEIKHEEKWMLWPETGGIPETYYLQASKPHGTVQVIKVGQTPISITEIDASGLPKIQTGV